MLEIQTISLDQVLHTSTTAGVEIDLRTYFVNPGTRELKCIVTNAAPTEGTDTYSDTVKLQGSSTTVDSDFVDITPLDTAIAAVTEAAAALQEVHFSVSPIQPYLRAYHTIVGVQPLVQVLIQAVKRVS